MAHFAELNENNEVLRVIVVANPVILDENGDEQESLGAAFCNELLGGTWKQTSYNNNMRKNFAGIGFTYDSDRDAFIPPQPYASWTLAEATCQWEPPVPLPVDENFYTWNEETTSWDQMNV